MDEDFNPDDLRPTEYRSDTELTLGPLLLWGLALGLVLLCGFCFWLGYSIGSHRARGASPTGQQTGNGAYSLVAGSPAKPSAAPQFTPQHQSGAESQPASEAFEVTPVADAQGSDTQPVPGSNPTQPIVSSAQPLVRPALSASATAPTSMSVSSSAQPVPALRVAPANTLMVQIAAISHQEDADVLVGALRKRGYAVNAHRDPADNLIHVRIGPFLNGSDANATRMKLLNDGYNAILQP